MKANFETGLKECTCCKEVKTLDQFGVSKATYDKLNYYCRVCLNTRVGQLSTREVLPEGMKKCIKCTQILPLSSFCKDISKGIGVSSYCKRCHNEWKETQRKGPKKSAHMKWKIYVYAAKQKNREFSITEEQYIEIVSQPCFYCKRDMPTGMDRIDSSLGYVLENVVSCCVDCNRMKMAHSQEYFLELIRLIANNHQRP